MTEELKSELLKLSRINLRKSKQGSVCELFDEAFIKGYQEGLKAKINMTTISDCPIKNEWHKVADGDLPDNTDSVLSDKGVIVYYNFTHACWVDERVSVEIDDVVAWCEIPQYKVE